MEFQVITDKCLPKIRAGRSIFSFFYRKDMASVANAVVDQKTDTGRMRVSSPELTALDLLRYAHNVGSIDAIATVLADLGDKIVSQKLIALAPVFERSVIQRLGYLLDRVWTCRASYGVARLSVAVQAAALGRTRTGASRGCANVLAAAGEEFPLACLCPSSAGDR